MTLLIKNPLNLQNQTPFHLGGVLTASDVFVLCDLYHQHKGQTLTIIAEDDADMKRLSDLLSYVLPDIRILSFPAWDCLPYDRVSPRKDIVGQRLKTLQILLESDGKKQQIVLTTPGAFLQRLTPKVDLIGETLTLKSGQIITIETLGSYLTTQGYDRVSTVREPGEYAIRGGIVDLYPLSEQTPYRLDFFGDDIESLKTYDPLTQRSLENHSLLTLGGTHELHLTEKTIQRFRTQYRDRFATHLPQDALYNIVSDGKNHPGMEHWLPLFYDKLSHLLDYISDPLLVFTQGTDQSFNHRLDQINDHFKARQEALKETDSKGFDTFLLYNPLNPDELYLTKAELEKTKIETPSIALTSFISGRENFSLSPKTLSILQNPQGISKYETLKESLKEKLREGKKIHVFCQGEGSRYQIIGQLQDLGFLKIEAVASFEEGLKCPRKHVAFHIMSLSQGFETDDTFFLSEREIYGEIQKKVPKKAKRSDLFIAEASALAPGDFVVHEEHGVGQFQGLHTMVVDRIPHDCVKLIYAGGDKLFLPVENIDLISRYGGEDTNATLDRLGAVAWQARRAKVKKRLEEIADHLIDIASARKLKKAPVFHPDSGLFSEFVHRFPFTETDDQLSAIEDVLEDLAKGQPMDRLVCGDVGFGKTEIALRAAFTVAASGKQVAIVAPTTLLARQHYQNFKKRFDGFGLRVEQLSRMITPKNAKLIKENLVSGHVDVVIGTHTLLAASTKFKDIGLVIVDEEQHFGVKQKERLKDLQRDIHVLTLTATPIPRTLQMSLTGVRDLSIIATPPVDRLTIRTFITPFDPMLVEEAIRRELNRNGQIFYVCPRLKDLDEVLKKLIKINPNYRIAIAHGQMPTKNLETVMDDFADHKYDILLSTNIIESGIDLPTVNTLFVHRSDHFGLAQLYQLRGRIGRGKLRAYAYLTIDSHGQLSKNALKRLNVMQTLDTLGAGFQLASHDMDIRGAGNLLGQEQSGHVREVGVELYQHLLEEAVDKARFAREHQHDDTSLDNQSWSPTLNLGVAVLIPETYVADLSVRMDLYRRLASFTSQEELDELSRELVDRFGAYPSEVDNVLRVMTLKQQAKETGVSKIDVGTKGIVLRFHKDTVSNPQALLEYIQNQRGMAKLRPDHSLFFTRHWVSLDEKFQGCQKLLTDLKLL